MGVCNISGQDLHLMDIFLDKLCSVGYENIDPFECAEICHRFPLPSAIRGQKGRTILYNTQSLGSNVCVRVFLEKKFIPPM